MTARNPKSAIGTPKAAFALNLGTGGFFFRISAQMYGTDKLEAELERLRAQALHERPSGPSLPDVRTSPTEFLTVVEAAAVLKVSRRTIFNWVASGQLRAVKFSPQCIRIPRAAIEEMAAACV